MSDYRPSIFLPATSFSMKANLREREPAMLARWKAEKLHDKIRAKSKGRALFILHSGPPYANGNIHIGHAFNVILKDFVVRSQQLLGRDAPLIPGWDCHGLPIEWKVEEKFKKEGRAKDQIPLPEFRRECRAFAQSWIDVQRTEFMRLGLTRDWENPYITMTYEAEADILECLFSFHEQGLIQQRFKPVLWSVVEKTALAEAEVEYEDKTSTAIYVRFPVARTDVAEIEGGALVIWTTTPWSLPGNRAIAFGPEMTYVVMQVESVAEGALARAGERLVVAESLADSFAQTVGITKFARVKTLAGTALAATVCRHPFAGQGYDFDVPLLGGEHVTAEAGTGLVHTAPSHGLDDYLLGEQHGLEVPNTLTDEGTYQAWVPLFAGTFVFKADTAIIEALQVAGALVHQASLTHSYPHSWRSKAPLLYRATPQWFIELNKSGLRQKALGEIDRVKWLPPQGQNRIRGMVEGRPEWCISRQRAWGVPIALFVHKASGQPLQDKDVNARILDAMRKEGADCWFDGDPRRFLGNAYAHDDYTPVMDIVDVWFDSGATQSFVLKKREGQAFPADLYLEGSDQHRGWFQSSLLVGCGVFGQAPYKTVLTHGFTVDEQGRKMSKSLGNTVAPAKIADTLGVEILRLWVASCDASDDLRIGTEILKRQEDIYRRYRNTLRYLLGALSGFEASECVAYEDMPELEQWVLHRIATLNALFKTCAEQFEFQNFYSALHHFCSTDLSAFYFDLRKDTLYCDSADSIKRRATRTVMDVVFTSLAKWLSPLLCFTAEEAWLARHGEGAESVHLSVLEDMPSTWVRTDLEARYEGLRAIRSVITTALEQARTQGMIGSSLGAHVTLYDPDAKLDRTVDFAMLAIVSSVDIVEAAGGVMDAALGFGVQVSPAKGQKCERCWRVLEEVGHQTHDDLCVRCDDVVASMPELILEEGRV